MQPSPPSKGFAYVVGTFDTKGRELAYIGSLLKRQGTSVVTVDLSTSGTSSTETITPAVVAAHHPGGAGAVFTSDRGSSIQAMAIAFERFIRTRIDVAGIISAGGSGGTALVTPAMRALPIGLPKLMVSTVASGNVAPYVGTSDISLMYSVTDVQGLNRISQRVLANAAHAMAGMINAQVEESTSGARLAVGLTMFGVTTPCVQAVVKQLESRFDCLVFHATGVGGRSMEQLVDSRLLSAVIDITTTEVADMLVGGIFPATEDRFGAIIRTQVPYVGSCGALDMVNFGAPDTVPSKFSSRVLYEHNPQITLMRTTPEENTQMGRWIATRLNQMQGPVRFVLPLGGVSLIDLPGKAFHDPDADSALFEAIEANFDATPGRHLIKLDYAINDPKFSAAIVELFNEIAE